MHDKYCAPVTDLEYIFTGVIGFTFAPALLRYAHGFVISILQSMTSVLYKGAILNQPRQFPPVSKLESLVRDFPLEKHGEPLSDCLE